MSSIRLRLLKWLIGPILVINLAGASLTYLLAWMPAQLAFDQDLADAAVALSTRLRVGDGPATLDLPRPAEQLLRVSDVDAFYFAVRASTGRLLAGDPDFPRSAPAPAGAHDAVMRGEPVRVSYRRVQVGDEGFDIGVAKTMRQRLQLRSAVLRVLVLLASIFTIALVGLIWFAVSASLRPLARMRSDLKARKASELAPIDASAVPYELEPVVAAFNDLLERVQSGARAQHDFLADVAHQLRTPLAGFQLQLEGLAARQVGDPYSAHVLRMMVLSNERMIRQTKQLLALARAEPSHFESTRLEPLDLAPLVGEAVQYFVEQAGKKRIDIGFDLQPARLCGDAFLLRDLIDNVIDNAVLYTPPDGTVTVRSYQGAGGAVFEIEDSGPGIAPAMRARVFERHVRLGDQAGGSGLGLAIVRDIATAHRARVVLGTGPGGVGMLLLVSFPPPLR
jgi:two-component system sensor histidine kinase TctE